MRVFTGDDSLTAEQSLSAFKVLSPAVQSQYLQLLFFNELLESGLEASGAEGSYQRGYDAIATMFPADSYEGDLNLFFSRIYTTNGGDITLFAPGGVVNAGLASASTFSKDPGELGIVATGGNINAYVRDDFLVNQSRVFAIDGSIMMWSSAGDIDAGRGAKTALSAPPPNISFDANGGLVVTFPPAVSGSGIRTVESNPDGIDTTSALSLASLSINAPKSLDEQRNTGDVFLFAPTGAINAGDAGIGSAGNLTVGAVRIVGADNFDVGGVSVGVPVASSTGFSGSLAGVSNVAATANAAAESTATEASNNNASNEVPLGILTVEVLGYGE
jgi:hypothetical protein